MGARLDRVEQRAPRGLAVLAVALGIGIVSSLAAGAASATGPAAAEAEPGFLRAALTEPREVGRGTLRFLGMRVYEAILWTAGAPRAVAPESLMPPFDRDFALELVYAMSLPGARIAERSDQEIGRQPDRGSAVERANWLARMRAIFPDVRAGDRITGIYRVGGPTRFLLNDKPLGEVDDPAFGRAFFGIWLDPRTSEPALREALLRGLASGAVAGARAADSPVSAPAR
ncbi:MAG: hypothetical protein EBT33_08285 [Betaproteobacteria bacterium]|nr:hypothetical protein [Betaproteobacteria bacterium]